MDSRTTAVSHDKYHIATSVRVECILIVILFFIFNLKVYNHE
jgi:hypothetical protein